MLQTHACDGRCFPSWRPERFGTQGDGRLQHGVTNEGDVTLDQERLAADVVEVAELGVVTESQPPADGDAVADANV